MWHLHMNPVKIYFFFLLPASNTSSPIFFSRNMQLYLLFLPEYIEEIGSTFLLRKSFHKVWIELNILPASCPHKFRSGNTTPPSLIRLSHYSGHSHWMRNGWMGCAGPVRVLPETFLLIISGVRALLSEAKLDSSCWQLFLP